MRTTVITPHRAQAMARAIRAEYAEARALLRAARAFRASGSVLDREEADGCITLAWLARGRARAACAALRTATVERYSAMSPAARARHGKFSKEAS